MTLDEAIRHCEEAADRLRQGCDDVAKGCEADHRQLAEWLRELKERRSSARSAQPEESNCEYCREDGEGYVTPLEKNGHAFVRFGVDGWELSLKANGWHGRAKIKFCPMCGRRLTDG